MADGIIGDHGHRTVQTTIDEFFDHVDTAHVTPMVLRPGAMRVEIVSAVVGGVIVNLVDYTCPVATSGEALPGRVGVLTPFGRLPIAHMNGVRVRRGTAHAFGGSAELTGSTAGATGYATLSFAPDALERMAKRLGIEIDLPVTGSRRTMPAPSSARLERALVAMKRSIERTGLPAGTLRGAAALADDLVAMFAGSFAVDRSRAVTRCRHLSSVQIVRQCGDYATDTHFQAVTLADLCEASAVSERRVRQAFYECYGLSPTAFLRIAALHEVRRTLLTGPQERDAVSRAAVDFGFWHLSRFASQYRALFGELPSMTLRPGSGVAAG